MLPAMALSRALYRSIISIRPRPPLCLLWVIVSRLTLERPTHTNVSMSLWSFVRKAKSPAQSVSTFQIVLRMRLLAARILPTRESCRFSSLLMLVEIGVCTSFSICGAEKLLATGKLNEFGNELEALRSSSQVHNKSQKAKGGGPFGINVALVFSQSKQRPEASPKMSRILAGLMSLMKHLA